MACLRLNEGLVTSLLVHVSGFFIGTKGITFPLTELWSFFKSSSDELLSYHLCKVSSALYSGFLGNSLGTNCICAGLCNVSLDL
ncbi:hypothetical protein GDO81_000331 [Engystomops pustulosus]|uniref:Secreted protein n=1 Tax=Engystomops pustulosus TaxID=76066 RepID=A0AAV7D380_ENGPU|nr:hypothetical protein GDO81_000331 [Engystomops pustulosus]